MIPSISAITSLENITLGTSDTNYRIFVNGTANITKLDITNETINIFELQTGGNFTNTGSVEAVLGVYDLLAYFPYNDARYDNGTIIYFNMDNQNITLQIGQRVNIYDFSGPVITILNPPVAPTEKSSPVLFRINISEDGTCELSMDGDATRYLMTTLNLRQFELHRTLADGPHTVYFYCQDTLNNSRTASRTFSLYTLTSGPGTSGGFSTGVISLENVTFVYDRWEENKRNSVFVYVRDSKGNLFDPEIINITLLRGVNHEKEIVRKSKGIYEGKFKVLEDVESVFIEAVAEEKGKKITEEVEISLEKLDFFEKIANWFKNRSFRFRNLFLDNTLKWICYSLLLLIIATGITLEILRRRKENQ